MFRQYRVIDPKEFILVAVDTTTGLGDYTGTQFLSKTRVDVPLVYHSKVTTSEFIPLLAEVLGKIFNVTGIKPLVAIERNNGGNFLVDKLAGINYQNKYEIFKMPRLGNITELDPVKLGWETNTATRPAMLSSLKDAVDKNAIGIYDKPTINELYSFIKVQTNVTVKAQAERGAHDDLVMPLAIVWQMFQMTEMPKSANDYERLMKQLPIEDFKNRSWY